MAAREENDLVKKFRENVRMEHQAKEKMAT